MRSLTLMGAAEDLENDLPGEGDDVDVNVDIPAEVTEAEGDVEETQSVIDDSSDDVEQLEAIKDVLEDAAENGEGIDETAAKVVEVAVEGIYARLGIHTTNLMGSMESFSNARTRVTATKIAAEAIGETISKAWEAIRKFFKNLWEKIKELYKSFMAGTLRLRHSAKAMREKLARMGSVEKKEETFKDKSLANAFCDKGGKVTAAGVSSQVDNTHSVLEGLQTVRDKVVDALEGKKGAREAAAKEVFEAVNKIATKDRAKDFRGAVDSDHATATEYLLGNRAIVFVMDAKEGGKSDDVKFDAYVETRKAKEKDEDISVFDLKELQKWCSDAVAICDKVDALAKKDKDYDKIMRAIDKAAAVADKKDNEGDSIGAATFRSLIKVNGKLATAPKSAALKGSYDLLRLVKRCAGMYKKD